MWDVIVVGCGPAGAMAAYDLAKHSFRVLMLEKAKLPRYKTCGGGLVQRTVNAIPFSLENVIEREIRTIRLTNRFSTPVMIDRAEPIVLMTMRSELDSFLTNKAVEKGADLMDQQAVTGISENKDRVECKTASGCYESQYLIGADGANSVVARQLGFSAPRCGVALEVEVSLRKNLEQHANRIDFDFNVLPKGYGWIFPKADHLSCGVFTMQRNLPAIRKYYDDYIRRKEFAGDIAESNLSGHLIPLGPLTKKLNTTRTLLIGDAAGLADPLTGEGISFAVRSGLMAANTIRQNPQDLNQYSLEVAGGLLTEIRISRWAARGLYITPSFLYNRLAHKSIFTDSIVDLFSGKTTYQELARQAFFKFYKLL